jgi:leucine dehydrogenase
MGAAEHNGTRMADTAFAAEFPDFDFHEQVVMVSDRASGLQAIIAVHDTTLGPALGGCRMWPYASFRDAITDVLRLSRGMSYKAAIAGLPLGGGKSVVIGDSRRDKTPDKLRALGRAIEQLGGRYITAEDVGTSPEDMSFVREGTKHVAGIAPEQGGLGDPSPMTALGTFVGIQAAVKHQWQRDDLKGLTVAVQGLGHVGMELARLLHEAGAKLIVSDPIATRLEFAALHYGAQAVALDAVHAAACDVFAPCALGAIINPQSIEAIQAKIIAGASNNQLSTSAMGDRLHERGILYAPDYVINGGGLIKVCAEYFKTDAAKMERDVRAIGDTLLEIFRQSKERGEPTHATADRIARERIAAGAARRGATVHKLAA